MTEINWALAQPTDMFGAEERGRRAGVLAGGEQRVRGALDIYARDPIAGEHALVSAGQVDMASSLQRNRQQTEALARQQKIREAASAAVDAQGNIDPVKLRKAYADNGDIEGLQGFEEHQATFQTNKLKSLQVLNEVGLRQLGNVTDQASYERAVAQTHQLYESAGMAGAFPPLPAQYDPQIIRQLQERSLSTKDQIEIELKRADDARMAQQAAESARHNRATEGVAQGALGLARKREGRVAKGGGGAAPADNSDLNYLLGGR